MFHKTLGNMTGAGSTKPEYKKDITLNDYIERKEQSYKKKLTFEEWMSNVFFPTFKNNDYDWGDMQECWKAAQENM